MTERPSLVRATTPAHLQPPTWAEALIFDWDSTLADTTDANFLSLRASLGDHGSLMERDWYLRRTGLSTDAVLAEFAAAHGLDLDLPAMAERRHAAYLDRSSGRSNP